MQGLNSGRGKSLVRKAFKFEHFAHPASHQARRLTQGVGFSGVSRHQE